MLGRGKRQRLDRVDRCLALHGKRIIRTEHNMIGTDTVDQETQCFPIMGQAVVINVTEVCAGWLWQTAEPGRLHAVRVIDPSELIR